MCVAACFNLWKSFASFRLVRPIRIAAAFNQTQSALAVLAGSDYTVQRFPDIRTACVVQLCCRHCCVTGVEVQKPAIRELKVPGEMDFFATNSSSAKASEGACHVLVVTPHLALVQHLCV